MKTICLLAVLLPQEDRLEKRVSVDHRGGLMMGLAALSEKLGVPIDVDAQVAEKIDLSREVTLQLRDVTGRSAIAWFARLYGLAVAFRQDRVVLSLRDREHVERRMFDVSGVLRPECSAAVPRVDVPQGQAGVIVTLAEPKAESGVEERLADLLREFVEPGTWEGPCGIEAPGGPKLLVTHTPATLRRVERFLEVLRRAAPATVTVDADLFESDASLPTGILTAEQGRRVAAARKDPKGYSFSIPAFDGRRSFAMSLGQKLSARDVPDREFISVYDEAAVFSVRPALRGGDIVIDFRIEAARAMERKVETLGGRIDLPETSLVKFETAVALPPGGSALFRLPRRSVHPQWLWIRACAGAPGEIGEIEPPDPMAEEIWKKVEAAPAMDVAFESASAEDVAAWFRRTTGVNIVVDPAMDGGLRISQRARGLRPRAALERLFGANGIEVVPVAEALYVTPRAGTPAGLRLWNARDLCLVRDVVVDGEEQPRQEFTVDDLACLIQERVCKDQWNEEEGKSICAVDGLILVRNSAPVIEQVARFLAEFRVMRGTQVGLRLDFVDADAIEGPLSLEEADRLPAAKPSEGVTLRGESGCRLGAAWTRTRAYIRDYDGDKIVEDTAVAPSWAAARVTAQDDGVAVELSLLETAYSFETRKFGKYELETPLLATRRANAAFTLPRGRVAVVKLAGSRTVLVRAE